jgi:23S rRNA (cytidine2498-2'-O)-methyltransferase
MDIDFAQKLLTTFAPYRGRCIYYSFPSYESELLYELRSNPAIEILWQKDRLFLVEGMVTPCLWAQSQWLDPIRQAIQSIGEAQKFLRQYSPRWALVSTLAHRRCQLIQEVFKTKLTKQLEFRQPIVIKPIGAWTLEDPQTLWYSTNVVGPLTLGEIQFKEDKVNPPSRAYLKLWEIFTLYPQFMPAPGQRVIDMGSCPGGWTWVLQTIGCEVISVDKAPLREDVRKLPRVAMLKQDAFTLSPKEIGPIDCFFSDIICYPEKLYSLVSQWRESGLCERFICTIKFQGATDYEALKKFAAIPNSKLIHLYVNKHEVTWVSGF